MQVTDLACKYLEPWQGTDKSEITIAELLSHQSGLAEWRPLYFTDNLQENVAKQISRIPLTYPRNSGRRYSDLGFISLGEIVKAITGKDLPIAFAELVFNPLGMHNTSFGPITGEVVALLMVIGMKRIWLLPILRIKSITMYQSLLDGEIVT